MADYRNKKSSFKNRDMDPTYDVYDEDPLVELARIVSEEGGYLNISSDNEDVAGRSRGAGQAMETDYGHVESEHESTLNLENQLIEELEISMAPPAEPVYAQRLDETFDDEVFDGDDFDDNADAAPAGQFIDEADYAVENELVLAEEEQERDEFVADQFAPHQEQAQFEHHAEPDVSEDVTDLLSEQDLSELEQALAEVDQFDDGEAGAQFDGRLDDERLDIAAHGEFDDLDDEFDDLDDNFYAVPPAMPVGAPTDVEGGRGSGRKIFAIAAVLSIAVLGGGVFAMMSSTNNQVASAPPLFKAGDDPLKIAPDSESDVASDDTQSIFDAAATDADPAKEELVERAEKPVDRIAALNGDQQSNGFGTGSGPDLKDSARLGGETNSGAAAPRMEPIGPKQVTTVKVNADGTIIRPSLDETGPSAQVDEEPIIVGGLPDPVRDTNTAAVSVDESRPVPVRVVEIKPTNPNTNAAAGGEDAARSQVSGFAAVGAQDDGGPVPRIRPDEVPNTQVATVQPSQTRGLVAQPSPQGNSGPVNLLDSNANTRQPAPTPVAPQNTGSTNAASGYLVQLSAQRSEDQALAAFNGMKAQFPSLLGSYQPSIQRADLGSRGIYYRVRVGPMASQGAANEFCEQLKSSGGNCFVTR